MPGSTTSGSNLQFEQGDASQPHAQRFDLITAFEVIEHLDDWRGMLSSARGALTERGLFLVSTPNKPLYAEARGESGGNPFHVHEFEYAEFREALERVFPHVEMLVQNHSAGILFSPVSGANRVEGAMGDTAADVDQASFFVALCALEPAPAPDHFFWISSSANLLRERDRHIALLRGEIDLKTKWERQTRDELGERNREYEEILKRHQGLQDDLETLNRWALKQDDLLRERGDRIVALQNEAADAHRDYANMAAEYEKQVALLRKAHQDAAKWVQETEQRLTAELDQRGAMLAQCVELLHAAEQTIEERTAWAQNLDRDLATWRERFEAVRQLRWVRLGTRLRLMDLR